jgi:hypothetical protein
LWGTDLGVGLGRKRPPASTRWRPAVGASGAWALASRRFGQDNTRMGEPQGVLAEVKAKRVGGYNDRKGMLAVGALVDGGGPSRRQEACAREGETRASYSGRRLGAHEGRSSRGVGTGMGVACYVYGGLRLVGRRKVGALDHGACGAWRKGSGGARRCGARGSHGAGRQTEAGLGVRAHSSRGAATCDAGARSGAPGCPKPFELAHFDQVLLKILQLKCHKQSIPKL